MRFAWLRKNTSNDLSAEPDFINQLTFVAYNAVYWIPMVLPFIGIIEYRTGFIAFATIIVVRAVANLYRNNVLTLEQGAIFPFRAP